MICAAVSGLMVTKTRLRHDQVKPDQQRHAVIFMPLQRMQMMVATMLSAVPMEPMPLRRMARVQ